MGIDHSNPYIHSTTVLCDILQTSWKKNELVLVINSSFSVYNAWLSK